MIAIAELPFIFVYFVCCVGLLLLLVLLFLAHFAFSVVYWFFLGLSLSQIYLIAMLSIIWLEILWIWNEIALSHEYHPTIDMDDRVIERAFLSWISWRGVVCCVTATATTNVFRCHHHFIFNFQCFNFISLAIFILCCTENANTYRHAQL